MVFVAHRGLGNTEQADYLPGLALSAWGCGFVLGTQNGVGHLLTLADLGQMLRVQVLPLDVSSRVWLEGPSGYLYQDALTSRPGCCLPG